jgi:hypothetical protein
MGLTLAENQLHNPSIVQPQSYEPCEIHRRHIPLEAAGTHESFGVPDFKDRADLEMADILRKFEEDFRRKYGASLSSEELRAIAAIMRCRTPAMGGHIEQCNDSVTIDLNHGIIEDQHNVSAIDTLTAFVYIVHMSKQELSQAARAMGRRGHETKMKKLGLEQIQKIRRENQRLGGRSRDGQGRQEAN